MFRRNHATDYPEATMSEYIAGFDAGYSFVLREIERNKHLTVDALLEHLAGDKKPKPAPRPTRDVDYGND